VAYLYRHIRLDKNEVFYVGIGKDSKDKYERAKSKSGRNEYWDNVVNLTNYEIEIVLDDLTWEEAGQKEIEFIRLYGRSCVNEGPLTNVSEGGIGGCLLGSLNGMFGKGYKLEGENNGMFGIKHKESSIEQMKISWDIERKTKAHDRISGDNNPAKRSEVAKLISESKLGDRNPMKRQDVKDKMVESCKKTNELKRLKGIPRYKTLICNYCGKEGSANNMTRYHFQNCKQKQSI
jgi:hypothetical protein